MCDVPKHESWLVTPIEPQCTLSDPGWRNPFDRWRRTVLKFFTWWLCQPIGAIRGLIA